MHPENHYIILPSSHASSLQIYSPHTSSLVAELEVSPTNRITGPSTPDPISPIRISHVVVSPGGEWLATVDVREESTDFGSHTLLKLWKWIPERKTYALNTRIDKPHGKDLVDVVLFCPPGKDGRHILVTGGRDASIKQWRTQTSGSSKKGSLEGTEINPLEFKTHTYPSLLLLRILDTLVFFCLPPAETTMCCILARWLPVSRRSGFLRYPVGSAIRCSTTYYYHPCLQANHESDLCWRLSTISCRCWGCQRRCAMGHY